MLAMLGTCLRYVFTVRLRAWLSSCVASAGPNGVRTRPAAGRVARLAGRSAIYPRACGPPRRMSPPGCSLTRRAAGCFGRADRGRVRDLGRLLGGLPLLPLPGSDCRLSAGAPSRRG